MFRVEVSEVFFVKKDVLWAVFNDHAGWKNWTFMTTSFLSVEGKEDKNGVGAVRVLGSAGVNSYEEVTLFEPCDRMEYCVIKGGLPFEGHHATVTFEALTDGRTRIRWSCTFQSKIWGLGWLMKLVTQYVYSSTLKSLKRFPFDA